ncbi:MAG TPA: M2 family metallopeptidase [Gemmataceae bacterium]|nr:M2 family metallopeptidase [Gemmataceae bacterium]
MTLPRMGLLISFILTLTGNLAMADETTTDRAKKFIAAHDAKFKPLDRRAGIAWWDANISGKDEDFARKEEAQNAIDASLANPTAFAELKELKQTKDKGQIDDKIVGRCIDVLYLMYLEKQVDPALLKKIVAKANAVEQAFNVFRAKVDGKEMPDAEVRKVLKESKDSARRQAVWEASKEVGAKVEKDLKELVQLRNEAAKKLGFPNFHALQLYLNEQDGTELIKLFDDLDQLTREPFHRAKAEIDSILAQQYGIKVEELMPWHYHDPFFQESPAVFGVSLDTPFQKADLLQLCRDFYASIGLPIDDVIARSDLYPKTGKSPHAFCTDIDREGDVRVLGNIVNNEYWMGTMLHELGHSVYSSKNIPASLPYVIRCESHILTTEGVAMQFERFSKSSGWIEKMGLKIDNPKAFDEAAKKVQRNQLLIFSRWCQVMLRFEKSMYENPDQDLNKLWWDLVEKYQEVKRPVGRNAPDYGSKIHICSAPVYYHNYMMGQLFASQVHHAICRDVYKDADPNTVLYVGDKRVGDFMKKKVFEPGRSLDWRGLTKFTTGEELSPKAFAKDFQGN